MQLFYLLRVLELTPYQPVISLPIHYKFEEEDDIIHKGQLLMSDLNSWPFSLSFRNEIHHSFFYQKTKS